MSLPVAACVFVIRDGKILTVSRKEDPKACGFPGGKADEGETPAQTAARECFEETGLVVGGLRELYKGSDSVDFMVYTFYAHECWGEPRDMGEGHVEWVEPSRLVNGKFSEYNQKVLAAWRKMEQG